MSEHKYFLTGYSRPEGFLTDTTPQILTLVSQGFSEITRIGDKMEGTSLECRMVCYLPVSYSNQRAISWRFTGFIWKEQAGVGSEPALADIYDPNLGAGTTFLHTLQPFNHNKKIARKILWDKQWMHFMDGNLVSSNWFTNAGSGVFSKKFTINLTKLKRGLNKVNFQPASTIGRNHIMFCILTNTAGGSASLNFDVQFKYTFVDS